MPSTGQAARRPGPPGEVRLDVRPPGRERPPAGPPPRRGRPPAAPPVLAPVPPWGLPDPRASAVAHRNRELRRLRRVATPVGIGLVAWVGLLLVGAAVDLAGNHLPPLFRDAPTPGREVADAPLGQPAPLLERSDAFVFLQQQPDGDGPVAYDPCRPVHYVVRPFGAPVGSDAVVDAAFDAVAAATGLRFVSDGTTDEAPRDDRDPFQPTTYGDRWAPVLVAWSSPADDPHLAGDVAGRAASTRIAGDHGRPDVYVTGEVVLDGPAVATLLAQPDGEETARAVVAHELGHLVGLAHVDDPGELMDPRGPERRTTFGPGDLQGLSRLGRGACAPWL